MAKTDLVLSTAFGDYRLGKLIDEGGNGYVYSASDADGAEVAIKILNPRLSNTQKRKRFKNEIGFCSSDRHPGLLRVIDWGIATKDFEGAPFYVMPRYPMTMRDLINKPLGGEAAIQLFDQILTALSVAHVAGVVHRDLKPENILYDPARQRPVIADFGIAHFTADDLLTAVETRKQERLANFAYCAPEQRAKGQHVGQPADIFALGLMLNEAVTGQVPHGAEFAKISGVLRDFAFLDDVVTKAIQNNPEGRYTSAEAMRTELRVRAQAALDQQQLTKLKLDERPEQEWADRIVANPITVVRDQSDWKEDGIIVKLSQAPTPLWVACFQRVGGSGLTYFVADRWDIRGDFASAYCESNQIENAITELQRHVRATADLYPVQLKGEADRKRNAEDEKIRKQIAQEEERQAARRRLLGIAQ